MKHPRVDERAFRYAVWSSLSKVMGVALGSGAGVFIHQLLGDNIFSWGLAMTMAISSYLLMFFAEYQKEKK